MFTPNKYTRWYYQIIDQARFRPITGYTESHHVIPKCIGGKDTKDNRVILTAREHALCHWLLTKMTSGTDRGKMFYALRALVVMKSPVQNRFSKVPTKTIAKAREEASAYSSKVQSGRKRSQESIEKQRATMTGRTYSAEWRAAISAGTKGIKKSLEHTEKNRQAHLGKKLSDEHKANISKGGTGRLVSQNTREIISQNRSGTKLVNGTWVKS